MNIAVKNVGKLTWVHIDGTHHVLTQAEVRRLRSELNHALQQIADKRKQNA